MVHTTIHLSMGREFAKLKSLRAEFLQDVLSSGTSHKSGNPHTLLTSETNLGVSTTTLRFHNLLEQFTELRKVLHLELWFSYSKGIQIRINQVFPPHRAKSGRVSNMKFPFSQDVLLAPTPRHQCIAECTEYCWFRRITHALFPEFILEIDHLLPPGWSSPASPRGWNW